MELREWGSARVRPSCGQDVTTPLPRGSKRRGPLRRRLRPSQLAAGELDAFFDERSTLTPVP